METRFLLRASRRLKTTIPVRHMRHQHTSKPSYQQANPIGDYYASLLESPTPEIISKLPTAATRSDQSPITTTDSDKPIDKRPAIIFSSRLSSPLERRSEINKKSTLIAGVLVPPRPEEPDDCCMSGCVNCVWDRYRDEIEEWAAARKEADHALQKENSFEKRREKQQGGLTGTGMMLGDGEKGATHTMVSMDDDGGGSQSNWASDVKFTDEELFKDVPVGIREFMKQEKRLKEKHARERSSGG